MPRKTKPTDQRLLTKISKLYYEQALTQQDIADRLQLSRPKVSRLLQEATERGIVRITVLSPAGFHTDLEQALEQQFNLLEAVVVEVGQHATQDVVVRELGIAAASYLQRTLIDDDIIGISWGTTLNAMVNALSPMESLNTHVVQLIGGLGPPEAEVHASDICRRFARLMNSKLTLIAAPGIVDTLETKQALLSDRHIRSAFDLFPTIKMAFVGIGVPLPTSVVMRDGSIMTQAQLDHLLAVGAVGDIGLRFFDVYGKAVTSPINDLVFGITLDQLQKIDRVVGVAGGLHKFQAVCGALRGNLINILITDAALAHRLVMCGGVDV